MRNHPRLNNGVTDAPGFGIRKTSGVAPKARAITANPGESIASLTQRAYGANTYEYQEKLRQANGSLTGSIIVPR